MSTVTTPRNPGFPGPARRDLSPRETSTPERCPNCRRMATAWSRKSSSCFACETRERQFRPASDWDPEEDDRPALVAPEMFACLESVDGKLIVRRIGKHAKVTDYIKTRAKLRQPWDRPGVFSIRKVRWELGEVVDLFGTDGEPIAMDESLGMSLDFRTTTLSAEV